MMARLLERGRVIGERRAEFARARVAARLIDVVPGVVVSLEGNDVVVAGRGLRWRAVSEPALRWIGSLLR